MTDYLDELLEQQEQEEADGLMVWRKRRVRGTERRRAVLSEQTAEQRSAVHEADGTQMQGQARGAAQLLQQVQRLHRAVRQAAERGRGTVSQQTAVQWDAAGGRHGTTLPSRRTADYAAAVDLAFQRDARRYDGPMELPR